MGVVGRLNYFGAWVDHFGRPNRSRRRRTDLLRDGRYIVDLEASISVTDKVTLAFGGQNVLDTFSQRMDLFAEIFGLPYSQFTPWGLSGWILLCPASTTPSAASSSPESTHWKDWSE